jgi:thymidylate kinase
MKRHHAKIESRARIIVLEGAAGTGKTALRASLERALRKEGYSVKKIPEFSGTPLGKAVKNSSFHGATRPPWLVGMGGTLAYLADKIHLIETVDVSEHTIWIADRFILTQLVLGLKQIPQRQNADLLRRFINDLSELMGSRFAEDSLLVILDSSVPILRRRLYKRSGKILSREQLRSLRIERQMYSSSVINVRGWKTIRLDSSDPIIITSRRLMAKIRRLWKT